MKLSRSRRKFLEGALAVAVGAGALPIFAQSAGKDGSKSGTGNLRFRTIAFDVGGCKGFPAAKARAAVRDLNREMPRRFVEALRRFSPDLLTFGGAPSKSVVREMAAALGMEAIYFASPGAIPRPGALLTRLPIAEQANCPIAGGRRPDALFAGHWGRAVVQMPGGDVVVHSLGLNSTDVEVRASEIEEVQRVTRGEIEAGRSVLVQGNLGNLAHMAGNADSESWADAGFTDALEALGRGMTNTFTSNNPTRRLDTILAAGPIAARLDEARVLYEPPFRFDARDRASFALSEHLPVMASFAA